MSLEPERVRLYDARTAAMAPLLYGPALHETMLILENPDGEGGGYDVYHSRDSDAVFKAANACIEYERYDRAERVKLWKKYNWQGISYSKLPAYEVLVIYADGSQDMMLIPEEDTGL